MARIARNRLSIPSERNRDILIIHKRDDFGINPLAIFLFSYRTLQILYIEATEDNQNLTTNTKEVAVESGTIYYWSVTTSDGSISVTSDVFSFRVN